MAYDTTYLFAIAPEFVTTDAGELARIEIMANIAASCHVSSTYFLTCYTTALAYMVAHLLKVGDNGSVGASGPVSKHKARNLEIAFHNTGSSIDAWLALSPYGVMFQQIRDSLPSTPMVTGGAYARTLVNGN